LGADSSIQQDEFLRNLPAGRRGADRPEGRPMVPVIPQHYEGFWIGNNLKSKNEMKVIRRSLGEGGEGAT
jgi:hypothetical protein